MTRTGGGERERRMEPGRGGRLSPSGPALLAVVLGLALVGCSSLYDRLRPESAIARYGRWLARQKEMQRHERLVPAGKAGDTDIRLALEEVGTGDRERVDVLIHGVLSDRRTWRYVAVDLAAEHDVLMVDLPGCGGSDKPDPADVPEGTYSPTGMARHVAAGLRSWLATRQDKPKLTLVAHSLGTAVTLRLLGDPEIARDYDDVLERVDRAVLFSPLTFAFERKDPLFVGIVALTATDVTMAEVAGILRGTVAQAVWTGVDDPESVPREEADRLYEILWRGDTRRAGQAMLHEAVPFLPDDRCDWKEIERLEAGYGNVKPPCLLVCGGRDETLPQAMGFRLQRLLPHAWLRVIPKAKHTLPTECPEDVIRYVLAFDREAGKGWREFAFGQEATGAERPAEPPAEKSGE